MKKINLYLVTILLLFAVNMKAQEYIDVTVRLDDYWAELTAEIGGAEPTWHTYFTIGGNSSSTKHVYHADPGGAYANGLWYNQSYYYYPVTKVLDNNDNLVIYLEGWEEDKTVFGGVWDYLNFDANDENHSTGSESNTNISANSRAAYVAEQLM